MNIQETLAKHTAWLWGEAGGERADLTGANLTGAKGAFQFGPMPTSGRISIAVRHPDGWKVKAGCFFGGLDELEKRVKESHNCPVYMGMIEVLKKI